LYPDALIPKCPDVQMSRCPDSQIPRCPDAQMYLTGFLNVQAFQLIVNSSYFLLTGIFKEHSLKKAFLNYFERINNDSCEFNL